MTPPRLVRGLGLDRVPYSPQPSTQNSGIPWPAAVQFYVLFGTD